MSDKEKALDALQTIINLAACHTLGKITDEILKQSEVIQRVLNQMPTQPLYTSEIHLICHYAPGRSIPLSEAQAWYTSGDQNCQSCGERCQ